MYLTIERSGLNFQSRHGFWRNLETLMQIESCDGHFFPNTAHRFFFTAFFMLFIFVFTVSFIFLVVIFI